MTTTQFLYQHFRKIVVAYLSAELLFVAFIRFVVVQKPAYHFSFAHAEEIPFWVQFMRSSGVLQILGFGLFYFFMVLRLRPKLTKEDVKEFHKGTQWAFNATSLVGILHTLITHF